LNDVAVRAIVRAAHEHDPALGLFVEVLAITGARPSQIARLTLDDLEVTQHARLQMPRSGKGGGRSRNNFPPVGSSCRLLTSAIAIVAGYEDNWNRRPRGG
jgi:integrase